MISDRSREPITCCTGTCTVALNAGMPERLVRQSTPFATLIRSTRECCSHCGQLGNNGRGNFNLLLRDKKYDSLAVRQACLPALLEWFLSFIRTKVSATKIKIQSHLGRTSDVHLNAIQTDSSNFTEITSESRLPLCMRISTKDNRDQA